MTVCSCCVKYVFQCESTLYSYLNVKELLAPSRPEIWNLSDSNWTQTHNHLVCKRTLNYLDTLARWLSVRLRTKWLWVRVQLQTLKTMFTNIFLNIKFSLDCLINNICYRNIWYFISKGPTLPPAYAFRVKRSYSGFRTNKDPVHVVRKSIQAFLYTNMLS